MEIPSRNLSLILLLFFILVGSVCVAAYGVASMLMRGSAGENKAIPVADSGAFVAGANSAPVVDQRDPPVQTRVVDLVSPKATDQIVEPAKTKPNTTTLSERVESAETIKDVPNRPPESDDHACHEEFRSKLGQQRVAINRSINSPASLDEACNLLWQNELALRSMQRDYVACLSGPPSQKSMASWNKELARVQKETANRQISSACAVHVIPSLRKKPPQAKCDNDAATKFTRVRMVTEAVENELASNSISVFGSRSTQDLCGRYDRLLQGYGEQVNMIRHCPKLDAGGTIESHANTRLQRIRVVKSQRCN